MTALKFNRKDSNRSCTT